ncbi:hypothetical protein MFUR16E_17070 [Methylobacterium fujisawaense]|uniref:hypothetical protein n=1 Tax=Methylobacterium fujisawaense TaxID=107400 RepID=UPI002F2E1CE9
MMEAADAFDAMAQACIATHKQIMLYGSSEMQTASRILLLALVEEIRQREQAAAAAEDDEG